MAGPNDNLFPLEHITNKNLADLCEALWNWRPCDQWVSEDKCQVPGCQCHRIPRLRPFIDYYRNVTSRYLPDNVGQAHPALECHEDLLDIIRLLRNNTDRPRSQLTAEYFDRRSSQHRAQSPPQSDRDRAFNIAARILTMTRPSAQNQPDGLLETGTHPLVWQNDKSLANFVNSAFQKRDQPALNIADETTHSAKVPVTRITAKRAKKVGKLQFIPTDDLKSHLLLDEKNGTVAVFHYTSVLKEHLKASTTSYVRHIQISRRPKR